MGQPRLQAPAPVLGTFSVQHWHASAYRPSPLWVPTPKPPTCQRLWASHNGSMLQRESCQPGHVPQDAREQPSNGRQQLQRKGECLFSRLACIVSPCHRLVTDNPCQLPASLTCRHLQT
jgi:hypothetical protein